MLHVDELTKDYGEFVALSGVSFELEAGTTTALVGHNGAGKSTLLRIVAGLLEATSGAVTVEGHEPGSIEARAATCFLADDPVLYDDLSVREHLQYVARLHGVDDWEERSDDVLERIGLAHRADDLPSRFSRGLRQRTSLALGFVRPFSLLLVDEPFVGLDAGSRAALLTLLADAAADGAAVLVSTHDLSFVERADDCIAMRDGEIVERGRLSPAAVLALVS